MSSDATIFRAFFAKLATLLVLGLLLASCAKKESAPPAGAPAAAPAAVMSTSGGTPRPPPVPGANTVQTARRYIALAHTLVIETPPETLQKSYEDILRLCEAQACEIVSAELQHETDRNRPGASIQARIEPARLEVLMSGAGKAGKVIRHNLSREDKTDEMIDVEARLENLKAARDQLRSMLDGRSASIKDVLEIRKSLTETQSELDSETGRWRYLTQLTSLVSVTIQLQARADIADRNSTEVVRQAWAEVGDTFMASLAALIRFGTAILPWLLVLIPGGLGLRLLWRKLRAG